MTDQPRPPAQRWSAAIDVLLAAAEDAETPTLDAAESGAPTPETNAGGAAD